ncbi:hypothetical protein D9M71_160380 [compost metagenome]
MLQAIGADSLGKWQGPIADRGVDHAEVEGTAQLTLERRGVLLETLHFAQQAQGLLMKQLALAGQAETTAPAMTQHDAQAGFELAHVSADGRSGKVELLLGVGEALVAHHADEDTQQFQIG